jgi:hypothetical protein
MFSYLGYFVLIFIVILVINQNLAQNQLNKKEVLMQLNGRNRRAATARAERLWDYGVIPYEIEANFSGISIVFIRQQFLNIANHTSCGSMVWRGTHCAIVGRGGLKTGQGRAQD